jgi:hypothetical protein
MLSQFIVGGTTVNAYDRIREFEMAEDDYRDDSGYRGDRGYRDYRDGGGVDKNSEDDQKSKEIRQDQKRVACRAQDYIILSIFWIALFLNSFSNYYNNSASASEPSKVNYETDNPLAGILEAIATFLYGVNVLFLFFQRIPCISDSVFPQNWRCCQCDCRAREYAITSAVFFLLSIGSTIDKFLFLG